MQRRTAFASGMTRASQYALGPGQWLRWASQREGAPEEPIVFDSADAESVEPGTDGPASVGAWRAAPPYAAEWYVGGCVRSGVSYEVVRWATTPPSIYPTNVFTLPSMYVDALGVAMTFTTVPDPSEPENHFVGMTVSFDSTDGVHWAVVDAYVDFVANTVSVRYAWKTGGLNDVKTYSTDDTYGAYATVAVHPVPTLGGATPDRYSFGAVLLSDRVHLLLCAPGASARTHHAFTVDVPRHPDDAAPRRKGEVLPYAWGAGVHEMRIQPRPRNAYDVFQQVRDMDARWTATT